MARTKNSPPTGKLSGKITKVDSLKLVQTGVRGGTQYKEVLDTMKQLKPGDAYAIDVPAALTVKKLQNRINGAYRHNPVTPPKGFKFRMSATEDGKKLAIILVEAKEKNRQVSRRFAIVSQKRLLHESAALVKANAADFRFMKDYDNYPDADECELDCDDGMFIASWFVRGTMCRQVINANDVQDAVLKAALAAGVPYYQVKVINDKSAKVKGVEKCS